MKTMAKALLCGVAALSLGGCQSFLAELGLAKRGVADASVSENSSRLALGREALKDGAPGTAIYHFERAVLDPRVAPDAYNGMGVAYAQLGREDLAERFFNAALMLRPNDTKIARNLDRLYNSSIGNSKRALAKKASDADALLALAEADALAKGLVEADANAVEKRGAVAIDRRRGQVQRASKQEIVLSGAETTVTAVPTRTAKKSAAELGSRPEVLISKPAPKPEPKVEIKAAEPSTPAPTKISANNSSIDYGQFVCLPDMKSETPKQADYPIRVSLAD